MPDHTIIELTANGNALQAYLGVRFVEDSGAPDLDAGDRCLVQPTETGGLLIQPLRALTYPVVVDGPPDGLDAANLPTEVADVLEEIGTVPDPPDVATNGEGESNQYLTNGSSAGDGAAPEPAATNANPDSDD